MRRSARHDRIRRADGEAISAAAALLRAGGLVSFPTETVYGLGAAARDPVAVGRVFAAKGRPADHPVIVHIGELTWLPRWASAPPAEAEELARAFWPGPLTLVLRRAPGVPDAVTGGADTVGLRMPAHPVAQALLDAFGDAIAAPSANRFGRISPTRAEHVAEELGDDVGLILDGGPCRVGVESTIVDLSTCTPRLLRPGGVQVEALEDVLGRQLATDTAEAPPRAPGTLASHYAPATPTLAVSRDALSGMATAEDAVLAFAPAPAEAQGRWIVLPADPVAAAHRLYESLRALDAGDPRRILIEIPPPTPGWRTVRDRVLRAATPR